MPSKKIEKVRIEVKYSTMGGHTCTVTDTLKGRSKDRVMLELRRYCRLQGNFVKFVMIETLEEAGEEYVRNLPLRIYKDHIIIDEVRTAFAAGARWARKKK